MDQIFPGFVVDVCERGGNGSFLAMQRQRADQHQALESATLPRMAMDWANKLPIEWPSSVICLPLSLQIFSIASTVLPMSVHLIPSA